ncbi:hypothetical protein HK104_000790 [Borealophlyctis nickersoniae]|nr:hypothetical protein HK104_000790 [Borealophlyctis nickersoniae]
MDSPSTPSYIRDAQHDPRAQRAESHLDAALNAPDLAPPEESGGRAAAGVYSQSHSHGGQHPHAHAQSGESGGESGQVGHAAEAAGMDSKGKAQRRETEVLSELEEGVGPL